MRKILTILGLMFVCCSVLAAPGTSVKVVCGSGYYNAPDVQINKQLDQLDGRVISVSAPTMELRGLSNEDQNICLSVSYSVEQKGFSRGRILCGRGYGNSAQTILNAALASTEIQSASAPVSINGGRSGGNVKICMTAVITSGPK